MSYFRRHWLYFHTYILHLHQLDASPRRITYHQQFNFGRQLLITPAAATAATVTSFICERHGVGGYCTPACSNCNVSCTWRPKLFYYYKLGAHENVRFSTVVCRRRRRLFGCTITLLVRLKAKFNLIDVCLVLRQKIENKFL